MPALPLYCSNCGLIFESRLAGFAPGAHVENFTFIGNLEQCPRCGVMVAVPDVSLNVIDDTIEVLAASDLTRERLARLTAILEAAQAGDISDEEAAKAVAQEAPELGSLMDRLGPHIGRAAIHLLLLALTILAGESVSEFRDHSATRQDVQQAMHQAVEQALKESRPEDRPPSQDAPERQRHNSEVFRLPDLLAIAQEPNYIIANRIFESCDFSGPAVFCVISGSTLSGNRMNGRPDALLWEIPENRPAVIGAFGFVNCDFLGCSFTNIGFAGSAEFVEEFRSSGEVR